MRHRRELEDKLSRFENRLKKVSSDIILRRRFTGLLNGLSLEMPSRIAPTVRSMPEVLTVVPNRKYHLLLTKSNELMNVPMAFQMGGVEMFAGDGIKIGIIDTGIDHTHVMFDDEGYEIPVGFPRGDTGFTNNKIIVARVFTKSGDSASDLTPRDRDGHGTHVASCAAGNSNTLSPLGLMSGGSPSVPGTEIPSYFTSHSVGLLIKDAIQTANVVEVEFYAPAPMEREQLSFELRENSKMQMVI